MAIVVLVEPVTKDAACRAYAADLDTFGPPSWLTMEDTERGPANRTVRCSSSSACDIGLAMQRNGHASTRVRYRVSTNLIYDYLHSDPRPSSLR